MNLEVNLLPGSVNSKTKKMLRNPVNSLLLLLFSLILYLLLGLLGDLRSEIETYWLIITPIYFIYIVFIIYVLKDNLPKNISYLWYILFGLIFRIVLIPFDPFLSEDI